MCQSNSVVDKYEYDSYVGCSGGIPFLLLIMLIFVTVQKYNAQVLIIISYYWGRAW